MQSKGSETLVVLDRDRQKAREEGAVLDNYSLLMHLSSLWGNVWIQHCHGFGVCSVACCTEVWAACLCCHASPSNCFSTDHPGQSSTHMGWKLSLFIQWLLLHCCTPGFLPWSVVGIPIENEGTQEAEGQIRGHPQLLVWHEGATVVNMSKLFKWS